jgi:tetratricopeptide (TPR) repeat protein
MLPNSSQVFQLTGFIDRRQGRWDESVRNLEKALEFDPRNLYIFQQLSITYWVLHRYEQMAALLDRALTVAPKDVPTKVARARVDIEWRADPKPLRTTVEAILAEDPSAAPIARQRLAASGALRTRPRCRESSARGTFQQFLYAISARLFWSRLY